ncbi:hypothetical protein CONCODRAFT_70821 [Conidiobolus coronatus NRRL 28638]|uniref:Uncharacterized protein n=1 Tax=Conidiobolus coronatus (strain ATCC 28846 / CBS 209.66 / NRRL 28638) TaxID=796925 RepID=A0A137P5F8_CONC2|nr:hypothetical protein CONCODRAFT_70821 [Conidiobolus coronatus NRRL 28638]|eukprot:KXN70237.1 hypothetical protein CONCODRAFT_70821 [Conidiobolus coronatus NRRL 28638]
MEEYDQLSNQINLLNNSFERIRLQLVNYKDYLEGLNKEMREVQELEFKEDIDLLTPPDSAHSSPEIGGINTRDGGVGHSLDIYFTQLDIMMEQLNQLNYAQQKHDTQLKSIKQQQESIESKVHQCLNQNSAITLQQSISYQNTINQAKSANLTAKKKRRWSFSSSKKSKKFNCLSPITIADPEIMKRLRIGSNKLKSI